MKATHHIREITGLARMSTALSLAASGLLFAQSNSSNPNWSYGSQNQSQYPSQPSNGTQIQVVRASNFIGTDLVSSDGRKLGDIVDFVFDTSQNQRLGYVLVMTGGFLDIGGTVRAVPAEAVTINGDTARAQIPYTRFMQIPKIEGDREQFFSRPENLAQLNQQFGLPNPRSNQMENSSRFVTFSTMNRRDALGQNGERIGYIDDAWISLDRNRAPFIEITPTINPFTLPGPQRYAVPMSKLQSPGQNTNRFTFQITMDELTNAKSVTDTPGVQMVNDGFIGNTVLRVTVPTVASTQDYSSSSGAGAPTGYPSNQNYNNQSQSQSQGQSQSYSQAPGYGSQSSTFGASSSEQLRQVAQQIRSAIDNDSSLRQANVQVLPQNDKIVLAGSVNSDWLRDRLQDIAQRNAQGTNVDNQVRVYQGQ